MNIASTGRFVYLSLGSSGVDSMCVSDTASNRAVFSLARLPFNCGVFPESLRQSSATVPIDGVETSTLRPPPPQPPRPALPTHLHILQKSCSPKIHVGRQCCSCFCQEKEAQSSYGSRPFLLYHHDPEAHHPFVSCRLIHIIPSPPRVLFLKNVFRRPSVRNRHVVPAWSMCISCR